MAFTLVDLADVDHDLPSSGGSLETARVLWVRSGLLPRERLRMFPTTGWGSRVTAAEAQAFARYLREQVLPLLDAGHMVRGDGSIVPVEGDRDQWVAALRSNARLRELVTFLDSCSGFEVW